MNETIGLENVEIAALLSSFGPDIRAIALKLRSLVLEVDPEAIEQIDRPAKMIAYGLARTYRDMICVIMPQTKWVNFGFPRGAEMNDPAGLLTGTGKKARHVKIADVDAVGKPEVRSLLEQARKMVRGE